MQHLITNTSSLFILILTISCSKQEPSYETDLLYQTLEEVWINNTKTVSKISAEVEKRGKRTSDVLILNKVENILEHRNRYKIPAIVNANTNLQDFKELNFFVDFLDSVRIADQYQTSDNVWNHHREAIDYFRKRINSEYHENDALNALLYLNYMERELITELAKMVGSSCWFGIDFNYHYQTDTMKVGEEFEMIITPDYDPEPEIDVSYESTALILDKDSIYDFELKVLGSAAYLKFLPIQSGTYLFTAEFKFTDFDYVYGNPVAKEIKVH